MNRTRLIGIAVSFMLVGLIIGFTLTSNLNIHTKGYTEETSKLSKESVDILTKTGDAMAELIAVVRPSVVNISTKHTSQVREMANPFRDDPVFRKFFGDDFFRQFEGPRQRKESSLGSGVIVDKEGYVLTNYHVIKDADEIKVTLSDKREFTAKVIGGDPKSDIAVIKINASDLPAIAWGDSDKLKIGETVIAIGSPYGLSQSVTSGIVSAKGRSQMGITDYEDFIQTDAAINPGNSGGALVNVKGQLIGVNTAIFSTSGGYQGIGFAIPSNMTRSIMDSIVKKGKVVRGWLGVVIQPVNKEIAKQFNLKDEKGIIISDVMEGGPAEKAGLQKDDVVVEYNGSKIDDVTAFRNLVAATAPGKSVEMIILRDGQRKSVTIVIGEQPEDEKKILAKFDNVLKGVHIQEITPNIRQSLDIPKRISGVVVADVDENSPSASSLTRGDVIMEINRAKVSDPKEYEKIVSKISKNAEVLIRLFREGKVFYIVIAP